MFLGPGFLSIAAPPDSGLNSVQLILIVLVSGEQNCVAVYICLLHLGMFVHCVLQKLAAIPLQCILLQGT